LIRDKCFEETPFKPEAEGEIEANEEIESIRGIEFGEKEEYINSTWE